MTVVARLETTQLFIFVLGKVEHTYKVQSRLACMTMRACQHRLPGFLVDHAARRVGGCLVAPTFLFMAVTASLHAPILVRKLRHS